jgi:hypothetical protein
VKNIPLNCFILDPALYHRLEYSLFLREAGLLTTSRHDHKKAVVFTLAPIAKEGNAIAEIVGQLKNEFGTAGLEPSSVHISSFGGASFSVPLVGGRIAFILFSEGVPTNWQIWILYMQSRIQRLLHLPISNDLPDKLQRAEDTIMQFLSVNKAEEIRWMSIAEAGERLPK